MKRYRAIANRYPAMEEHPQGIWVHFREVEQLQATLALYPTDSVGWVCSVCGGWNKQRDDQCRWRHASPSSDKV